MVRKVLSFLFVLVSLAWSGTSYAEVHVLLNRAEVQLNESFTIVLYADGGEQGEPVIGGLDEHFEILGRTRSSSMATFNGQRRTTRRWTYSLLPKGIGEFEIPPLFVDGVGSNPVKVRVTDPVAAPTGDPDVFITVTVDRDQTWVQAQLIYTLKIYEGVAVRQSQLQPPRVEGGEVIVERLGEDRRYEAMVGPRRYDVVERSYALFPQSSGTVEIQPAVFRGSLYSRGRMTAQQEFQSEALSIEILPAVPAPSTYPGAAWLPAVDVQIGATLTPSDGMLDEGEAASIVVNTVGIGLQASQLPELELELDPALSVYPDQPDYVTRALPDGVASRRQQSFAVIASNGGVYGLPDITLPWFDVDLGEWRVASARLGTLRAAGQVTATPQPAPLPVEAETAPASESPSVDSAPPQGDAAAWRSQILRLKVINYGLIGLWVVTLFLLWRKPSQQKRQRKQRRVDAEREAPFQAARKARKAARIAASNGDAVAARIALLEWARLSLGVAPAAGLTALARELPEADAAVIRQLDAALYGCSNADWDGQSLLPVLQRLDRPGSPSTKPGSGLPPLMPGRG